jgi:hypothetical protein
MREKRRTRKRKVVDDMCRHYLTDININYWIVIEMHIRGLFNGVSTTIPLSIGFEPENITFDEQYKPDRHHTKHTSSKHHRRHNSL